MKKIYTMLIAIFLLAVTVSGLPTENEAGENKRLKSNDTGFNQPDDAKPEWNTNTGGPEYATRSHTRTISTINGKGLYIFLRTNIV